MPIVNHLSNGCSFSTKKTYRSAHQKIGDTLGLSDTVMLAKGGRGNERIANTTLLWFLKNPERVKDTFVSIGWSSAHRWDYVHRMTTQEMIDAGVSGIKRAVAEQTYQWGSWRSWEQEFFLNDEDLNIEHTAAVKTLNSILQLQTFLKANSIPYVFYWALSNDLPDEGDISILKQAVDQRHFYNFEPAPQIKSTLESMFDWFKKSPDRITLDQQDYCQSHFEFCVKNNCTKSPTDGHPNQQGHHQWAQVIVDHIKKNNLLPVDTN
jgi:hypothetical protein